MNKFDFEQVENEISFARIDPENYELTLKFRISDRTCRRLAEVAERRQMSTFEMCVESILDKIEEYGVKRDG